MFGILDRFYAWKKRNISRRSVSWGPEISDDAGEDSWYCFVPRAVSKNEKMRLRLIPNRGKVVVYTVSYDNLMVFDVDETLENLERVYEDVIVRVREDVDSSRRINFLGVSLGNIFSFKVLGELGGAKNLISLVGGGKFGASAWDSILTKNIARNSGCVSVSEYENHLKEFSSVNYVKGTNVERLFARFARYDLVIPYKPHGKELETSLINIKCNEKDIKTYWYADHSSGIIMASKENIYG